MRSPVPPFRWFTQLKAELTLGIFQRVNHVFGSDTNRECIIPSVWIMVSTNYRVYGGKSVKECRSSFLKSSYRGLWYPQRALQHLQDTCGMTESIRAIVWPLAFRYRGLHSSVLICISYCSLPISHESSMIPLFQNWWWVFSRNHVVAPSFLSVASWLLKRATERKHRAFTKENKPRKK